MTEIEKMQRYIAKTKISEKSADRHCLTWLDASALSSMAQNNQLMEALSMAFNYGRAKGYRAAKAEVRA